MSARAGVAMMLAGQLVFAPLAFAQSSSRTFIPRISLCIDVADYGAVRGIGGLQMKLRNYVEARGWQCGRDPDAAAGADEGSASEFVSAVTSKLNAWIGDLIRRIRGKSPF